nr:baseplate J/gp47 family protein [Lewinella sp. W8]
MTRGTHLLGPDVHWIRASSAGNLSTAGRCRAILSNAVDASWIDNGDDHHLKTPPADRPPITEPVVTLAGISKVTQPAAFSKGMPAEQKSAYYVRNSERLRHKNRGVNVWDIERLVLESFPDIQQVKCIGKHMHEDILGVGEVLVVVIPRISGPNPTPRVGYHILQEIQEYLKSLSSVFADIRVINPVYERLKVSCHVKLTKESTLHRGRALKEVEDAIKNYVCPWLGGGSVNLGGSVSKTEILAIINECRHIQYTTGFSMVLIYEKQDDFYSLEDTAVEDTNAEILTASRPWSVLIPLEEHQIEILETDDHQFESITAIDRMRLEADFIILEEGGEDMDLPSPSGSGQDGAADFDLPPSWLTP